MENREFFTLLHFKKFSRGGKYNCKTEICSKRVCFRSHWCAFERHHHSVRKDITSKSTHPQSLSLFRQTHTSGSLPRGNVPQRSLVRQKLILRAKNRCQCASPWRARACSCRSCLMALALPPHRHHHCHNHHHHHT